MRFLQIAGLVVLGAFAGCGSGSTGSGTPALANLVLTFTDQLKNDGSQITISIAATKAGGGAGAGVVHLFADHGDLGSSGKTTVDITLDGSGKATTTLACDVTKDAACQPGRMRVIGAWEGVQASTDPITVLGAATVTAPLGAGFTWHECESSRAGTFCGTWAWDGSSSVFHVTWDNGAKADMQVIENDTQFVCDRHDPAGASTGLNARYTGTRESGNKVAGTVHFSWDSGETFDGTWTATW